MERPQGVNMAIIMPPPGTVVCPYLPPIPQISKVTGQVTAIQPLPCLGPQCAVYEGCQGAFSPRAAERTRLESRIDYFTKARTLSEKAKSMPMIGMTMEHFVDFCDSQITKLESELAALAPQAVPAPLPTTPEPTN